MMLKLGDKAFWMVFVIAGGSIITIDKISDEGFRLIIVGAIVFAILGFSFTKGAVANLDRLWQKPNKVHRAKLLGKIR